MQQPTLSPIGSIRLLQIQREALKTGVRPDRVYRTAPIHQTDRLVLTPWGATAVIDGGWVMDRHHVGHPGNGSGDLTRLLSVGFTSHYAAMSHRFGDVDLGAGGENVIVESHDIITEGDIEGGLVIRTAGGDVELEGTAVAEPCVPFTKHVLGDQNPPLDQVKDGLKFLSNGTRGFVMGLAALNGAVEIAVGDLVLRRVSQGQV